MKSSLVLQNPVLALARVGIQYPGIMPRGPYFSSFPFTKACQIQLFNVSDGLQQRTGFERLYIRRHVV